jgi:hypothetical protein
MKTLQEMREAVKNDTAQILTLDLANELKGKKIATIYFGYKGQDGIDEFIVGEIVSELDLARREVTFKEIDPRFNNRAEYWESYMTKQQLNEKRNRMLLLTADGRNTYIYAAPSNDGIFTCSDIDRYVFYVELPTYVVTHENCGDFGNLRLELVKYELTSADGTDVYLLRYPDGRESTYSRNVFDYEN